MEKQNPKKDKKKSHIKNKVLKEKETKLSEKEKEKQEEVEDRNGVIPEDMDFKKFLGCGG